MHFVKKRKMNRKPVKDLPSLDNKEFEACIETPELSETENLTTAKANQPSVITQPVKEKRVKKGKIFADQVHYSFSFINIKKIFYKRYKRIL
jgi:hypothetical protein